MDKQYFYQNQARERQREIQRELALRSLLKESRPQPLRGREARQLIWRLAPTVITLAVVVVVTVLALAACAPGAGTPAPIQPVGEEINFFSTSDPATFPAGKPFHIRQGHGLPADTDALEAYDFQLQVDDNYVDEGYVDLSVPSGKPGAISKTWLFNFPDGMSGTHTFVGHWLVPCVATDGPCAQPDAQVEQMAASLTVTFEPWGRASS